MKRLPDSEFAVLQAVWQLEEPITSAKIMAVLDNDKDWKLQTLLTLLARLTEKGFLQSTRVGRERHYQALVEPGQIIMEIKVPGETPDWLAAILDKHGLVNQPFSKYLTAYTKSLEVVEAVTA